MGFQGPRPLLLRKSINMREKVTQRRMACRRPEVFAPHLFILVFCNGWQRREVLKDASVVLQ
jgi:hypothetical protein